jgi:hypothetical protein
VKGKKHELGFGCRETFVPKICDWDVEVQVDWYEANGDLGGERIKLGVEDDAPEVELPPRGLISGVYSARLRCYPDCFIAEQVSRSSHRLDVSALYSHSACNQ